MVFYIGNKDVNIDIYFSLLFLNQKGNKTDQVDELCFLAVADCHFCY